MISPYKVPKTFTKLMCQCYVAVPYGGGVGRNDKGYLNGFHDMRVVRDLYQLWRHLHAKAANLAHQVPYSSCHDEDNLERGNMKFWEREVITILNCKFAGNATYEWWEPGEDGKLKRTNGFRWLPTPNYIMETAILLSQPVLLTLFGSPKHDLRTAAKIIKATKYDPIERLVNGFDLIPARSGEYRLFAPLEPMMKGHFSDFVPYISTSSEV